MHSNTDESLCYLTASECLTQFRAVQLRPRSLLEALLDRIERFNPTVNALADTYFEEAREQAKQADEIYAGVGVPRPLEGIPVLVKDAQRVKGKRTTFGSLLYMDAAPEQISDPMIERLKEAGAIIVARTTTPEFCISGVCRSRAWGNTVNPFNPDFGPGGSSGGSAAALAAGFAPIATGTDIGGSIRIPASCCGVVGFKAPHGRNPDGPPANFDRYNHCGPLARSIEDLALVQRIVSGAHPRDHDSLRETVELPTRAGTLQGIRIAYSMDLGYRNVDSEVRRNTLSALDVFRRCGAIVEDVELNWTDECDTAAMNWYNTMHYLRQTAWAARDHADQLNDYTLATAKGVSQTTLDDVPRSWDVQHEMYQDFGAIMENYDLFICPTNAVPAVTADHDPMATDYMINGQVVDAEYGWVLTHHFNMLHYCPVMAVPSGFSARNVPTGIQIVGKTFDDVTVFKGALSYEAECGGWFNDNHKRPSFSFLSL